MGVERGGHTELLEVALEQTDDELVVVDDEDVHSRQRPAHGVARAVCQAARSRATGWMARARFHPPAIALCGARKGSEADPLSHGSNRALSAAREPFLASLGPSPSLPLMQTTLPLPHQVYKAPR